MAYSIKEIFYSVQGEGANLGRPAVFCRFAGCNIWSGQAKDKANSICNFCDTDFVGTNGVNGGSYKTASQLAAKIDSVWRKTLSREELESVPLLVFTGGEPTLQLDSELVDAVKKFGFEIAIETNGTNEVVSGVDWITVSPKDFSKLKQKNGSELKLLFPFSIKPEQVSMLDFRHFYLSPICESDAAQTKKNAKLAFDYCLQNPKWKLTLQYHKVLGVM